MTNEDVMDIFTYHKPTQEDQLCYDYLGQAFRELAVKLNEQLPEGPGKTVAIHKLAEARMQANACVALKGKF